jgi:2,3-bisphosphoglycerate-independent phosphoglycerate mutase
MSPSDRRNVVLVVLDGWGYREEREGNAIALANAPIWSALWSRTSRTLLDASGLAVGLPAGQMGNSEVGHLNLGAGRVVQQDIVRIDRSISDGSLNRKEALLGACRRLKKRGGSATLHLVGLVGDGGVHSHSRHLFALVDLAAREGVPRIVVHGLMDGRDTLPKSGLGFMRILLDRTRGRAVVASLGGRYYGMDRDRRWDRTERFYRAAVNGAGPCEDDPLGAIAAAYERGRTDEFIDPVVVCANGQPVAPMHDGDEVLCFNFRADRMRQIVRALTNPAFEGFDVRDRPRVGVTTLTSYDRTFTVPVAFEPQSMAHIVAEVVSETGMTMFRTAETEKYAHVTYFFNGGVETPFRGEERHLVPSPKVATYDLMPEMSAAGVTDVLCNAITGREHDFILCNYANADMVGHSGSLPATIAAVEAVDGCLARVVRAVESTGSRLLITADHGNAEYMIDEESGGPHTAHTCSPVPFVLIDPAGDRALRAGGALCDVGPTVISLLGIGKPLEMTGVDLRIPA